MKKMMDQSKWSLPLVDLDWSALFETLYGVEQGDSVTMYNVHRDAAKKVSINNVGGERASRES